MNFVNNWQQAITLGADDEWCELDLPNGSYRLTLADKVSGATRWEIIEAGVDGGEAWLTRGLEGTGVQEWPAGSVIYCSITASVLSEVMARLSALEASGSSSGALTKDNYRDLIPKGYLGQAVDNDYGGLHIFNRKDIGFLIYGSLSGYVGSAPLYVVGEGPVAEFGEYQGWALGAARCQHVYTISQPGANALIGLAPPAGAFGSLRLSAPSFGDMYDERPAADFELSIDLRVPALASGDIVAIKFSIAGFSYLELTLDPLTRDWSVNGISLGAQGEYSTQINLVAGDAGAEGYPETAQISAGGSYVSVPLSPDRYASSSGIELTVRTSSVIEVSRIGGHVTYAHY